MRWIAMVAATMGCVTSTAVTCPDGTTTCPEGTICVPLSEMVHRCVDPSTLPPCNGRDDGTPCDLGEPPATIPGTCYSGACIESVCGDEFQDARESCDDGNNIVGDGCSADCQSDETCGNEKLDPLALDSMGRPQPNEECDEGPTTAHDGCSSTCEVELPSWQLIPTGAPPPRAQTASAFDGLRQRVVMFGGLYIDQDGGLAALRNDTWQWDGTSWIEVRSALAPSPRFGHAMAYDPVRKRVVLFGGYDNSPLGDTWELDGNQWRRVSAGPTPVARWEHAMAYLPGTGVVLFGGKNDTGSLDDTWVWNGSAWSELATTSRPEPRATHALALDPARGVLVLAGAEGPALATWELDGVNWRQVAVSGDSPSIGDAAFVYDPIAAELILVAGTDTPFLSNPSITDSTHGWNGSAWRPVGSNSPITPRTGLTGSNDPISGAPFMFGGLLDPSPCLNCDYVTYDQHVDYVGGDYKAKSFSTPVWRRDFAATVDTSTGRVLVVGGVVGLQNTGEIWTLDGQRWDQLAFQLQPSARYNAAMAYDSARRSVLLFGGADNSGPLEDTWIYESDEWTPVTQASAPSARVGHAMVFDVARGRTVLFGGLGTSATLADTWEWDGTAWDNRTPATGSPPPRAFHALGYDPIRGVVVLFGGSGATGRLRDLWEWDGTSWTQRMPATSVFARQDAALAWNPARRKLTLFGGSSIGSFNDTWEWDGTDWAPVLAVGNLPTPRAGHALVPTPSGVLVIAGDDLENTAFQSYLLSWTGARSSYESCGDTRDTDGDGFAACEDADCWYLCSPDCPPGTSCPSTLPQCGDGTCNTALENCRNCPGDCTCTARCGDLYCDAPETAQSCPGDCQ